MPAKKYLAIVSGVISQIQATVSSIGFADEGKLVALDSLGKLDLSLLPSGVGPDVKVVTTTEAIGAGKYVNIFNDAGSPRCRLASQDIGREAHGFVTTAAPILSNATIYFEGSNNVLAGLTTGLRQYLDIAGGRTETPPATGLLQFLGVAVSSTEINTDIADQIVLN